MGNSKSLIILFSLLFLVTGGGTCYAQMPPQDVPPATSTNEPAPQPEVPKKVSTIMVDNDRLSVEFVNVSFGEIIQAVGQKAGFMIEGSSTTFSKNVTTKFNDLEIDTGIMRLFSFAKESNYRIDYDTKGKMSKLKIYNIKAVGSTGAVGSVPQTSYGTGATGIAPSFRSRQHRALKNPSQPAVPSPPPPVLQAPRTPQVPQAPQVSQPTTPDQVPEGQNSANEPDPNEDVKEIPYIPPQKKPVYIPPITR